MRTYLLPYCDIMAWCLMPNHFHLMVRVKNTELIIADQKKVNLSSGSATWSRTPTNVMQNSINKSIGIMLASYTRAINKQQNKTGSLFRAKTKAECLNCPKMIEPSFIKENGITQINTHDPVKTYPQICFNYIHQNPVKANLVKTETDWEFSSARDYADIRDGKLVNKDLSLELGLEYKLI